MSHVLVHARVLVLSDLLKSLTAVAPTQQQQQQQQQPVSIVAVAAVDQCVPRDRNSPDPTASPVPLSPTASTSTADEATEHFVFRAPSVPLRLSHSLAGARSGGHSHSWTTEEHRQFLLGLEQCGRGHWCHCASVCAYAIAGAGRVACAVLQPAAAASRRSATPIHSIDVHLVLARLTCKRSHCCVVDDLQRRACEVPVSEDPSRPLREVLRKASVTGKRLHDTISVTDAAAVRVKLDPEAWLCDNDDGAAAAPAADMVLRRVPTVNTDGGETPRTRTHTATMRARADAAALVVKWRWLVLRTTGCRGLRIRCVLMKGGLWARPLCVLAQCESSNCSADYSGDVCFVPRWLVALIETCLVLFASFGVARRKVQC